VTLAGEIVIELNVRTVTSEVLDVMDPWVAVIETGVLLAPTTVARPAAVMLTAAELPECQVTEDVMLPVVPSLYVPTAEYWRVAFKANVTAAGEIVIELNVFTVTSEVLEVMEPRVAVIGTGVLLAPRTVTRPPLVMLTAAGLPERQVTEDVMLLVLPSLYVPVAEYWRVAFKASVTAAGEIVMERNVPTVTRETLEVREPTVPVIATGVLLAPRAVAIPLPLMLTAVGFAECHVTKFMMFCVVPSL
jgi:hypothetical protein